MHALTRRPVTTLSNAASKRAVGRQLCQHACSTPGDTRCDHWEAIEILNEWLMAYGLLVAWWLSGRALVLRFSGRGFNFQPVHFHVT